MNISIPRTAVLLAIVLAPLATLNSQQTNQSTKTPQFENAEVNVWKSTVMPNAPLTMHTHEHPRVIIALTGGTMKIVYESGAPETHKWETGKAYWLSTEEGQKRHADVNESGKPIEVMVVELKNAK